jgi:hypothetical protein
MQLKLACVAASFDYAIPIALDAFRLLVVIILTFFNKRNTLTYLADLSKSSFRFEKISLSSEAPSQSDGGRGFSLISRFGKRSLRDS